MGNYSIQASIRVDRGMNFEANAQRGADRDTLFMTSELQRQCQKMFTAWPTIYQSRK